MDPTLQFMVLGLVMGAAMMGVILASGKDVTIDAPGGFGLSVNDDPDVVVSEPVVNPGKALSPGNSALGVIEEVLRQKHVAEDRLFQCDEERLEALEEKGELLERITELEKENTSKQKIIDKLLGESDE